MPESAVIQIFTNRESSESQILYLAPSIAAVLVAIVGGIINYYLQNQSKRLLRNEKTINKYRDEIRARIIHEEIACKTISDLSTPPTPVATVKIDLRRKTREQCDIQISMKSSDLK
jgi:hypothetical protein